MHFLTLYRETYEELSKALLELWNADGFLLERRVKIVRFLRAHVRKMYGLPSTYHRAQKATHA